MSKKRNIPAMSFGRALSRPFCSEQNHGIGHSLGCSTAKWWCQDMSLLNFNFRKIYGPVAALTLLGSGYAYAGAFDDYAGTWSGNGTITIAEGGAERIRCRGVYTVDAAGNGLHQNIKCASDSYKFELRSDIEASNGRISGSWTEATRNVNGNVDGSISGSEITALVQTNGYAANFNVSTRGGKQNINISSKGELRSVTMALSKGN
jgi:hypothetical protein